MVNPELQFAVESENIGRLTRTQESLAQVGVYDDFPESTATKGQIKQLSTMLKRAHAYAAKHPFEFENPHANALRDFVIQASTVDN